MSGFSLRFTIPGDPVPKARARVGKRGWSYTPTKTVEYEQAVGWAARKALTESGKAALDSDARFALTMDFYLGTERRIDLDNLIKSVLDGLTPRKPRGRHRPPGLFWKDDSQVDIIAAQKQVAAASGGLPCAIMSVRML